MRQGEQVTELMVHKPAGCTAGMCCAEVVPTAAAASLQRFI
jgi:hypothetical protein